MSDRESLRHIEARYRENHRTEIADRARQRRAENPDHAREIQRKSHHKRQQSPEFRERRWRAHLKRVHGITPERYDALHTAQGGLCAICRHPETTQRNGVTKRLAVDHCHETGNIRGLLCASCNVLLGHGRDDTALLRAAIDYLTRKPDT